MNLFLTRCCDLAQLAGACVEPNPRVGAILVHEGRVIGEGYHEFFGGPHAEVNAIQSVTDKNLLSESTLYVSLEPCNHHGKTPPCCDLILSSGMKHVVIGMEDPNPKMAGKSIQRLRDAGVKVELANEAKPFENLNRHFILNQKLNRPFITLKWAQSADGFIAARNAEGQAIRTTISSRESMRMAHQLRREHQAILVGKNTIAIDNPMLNTRLVPGTDPIRIIWDSENELHSDYNVFQSSTKFMVLNHHLEEVKENIERINVKEKSLLETLEFLYREKAIGSILVEGGAETLQHFINAGIYDSVVRITAKKELGRGVVAPKLADGFEFGWRKEFSGDLVEGV